MIDTTRISASRFDRATQCLYWTRSDVPLVASEVGEAAERGTRVHSLIEQYLAKEIGLDHASGNAEEDQLFRMAAVELQGRGEWTPERAFFITLSPVQVFVADRIGRKYAGHVEAEQIDGPYLAGSADAVKYDEVTGEVTIVDFKTGRLENLPNVYESGQLLLLAFAATQYYEASSVRVELWHLGLETGVSIFSHVFEAEDYAAVGNWIAGLAASLDTSPEPSIGSECRYCEAKAACPELANALDELAPLDEKRRLPMIVTEAADIVSDGHAEFLVHRLAAAKGLLDTVERAVREYADTRGGIQFANGKTWARRVSATESIDGDLAAVSVLSELGIMSAARIDVSKARIKEAAKAAGLSPDRTLKLALEKFDALGLVKRSTRTTYSAK